MIDKNTLDLLQSYDWPGNIRELQNVIERSVILSSNDVFSVDELWLPKEISPPASQVEASPVLKGEVEPRSERKIIEAALAESRGRVSGPTGAAAKLGIPPSTLDHRIKALKIHKKSSSSAEGPIKITRVSAMAIVIEYYVPEKFRKQNGRWIPPEKREKIIPFPVLAKKSA